jgi:hypothetical protein
MTTKNEPMEIPPTNVIAALARVQFEIAALRS